MIPLKAEQILKHLKATGIEAQIQKETNQICIFLKIGERDVPLFIRIYDGEELLQMLAFLPCNLKTETLADSARLLHLLNKEIDIPGFGMDENTSAIFYRCMIPISDKQISKMVFDAFLNATQLVCKSFAAVIAAVAYGAVTYNDVLKKAQEHGYQSISQSELSKE